MFDLHCDTFSKLFDRGTTFDDEALHITPLKAAQFSPYIQVCAIWSNNKLNNNEAYSSYISNIRYLQNLGINFERKPHFSSSPTYLLAVEDARILNNDIDRLDNLFFDGVRILTLCWKDDSCIGGGWNTDNPLTPFGKAVVKRCLDLGITIDLSHSSQKVQREVILLCRQERKSLIFSHSNSYCVFPHKRNIYDEIFKQITDIGGIVGISLCCEHLEENASLFSVVRHIDHFLSHGGINNIALGCDFDGIDALPHGIDGINSLSKLYTLLEFEFGKDVAENIFFNNAYNFFNAQERR